MKKNMNFWLSAVSVCMLLSGCGVSRKDKTTPPLEDIVAGTGMSELREQFERFTDQMGLSEAIVYGEISDFEIIISKAGFLHTLETIHVIETLYGDIKPGSYVQLWETGGYAHPIDIINNFSNELDRKVFRESFYSTWTDEELETKYRAEVPEGYYYPEIGDRAVYCLKPKEKMEGIYRVMAGWMGKYREIEDGILAKPSTDNSVTNPEGLPGIDGTIPYEELKQQILEASD